MSLKAVKFQRSTGHQDNHVNTHTHTHTGVHLPLVTVNNRHRGTQRLISGAGLVTAHIPDTDLSPSQVWVTMKMLPLPLHKVQRGRGSPVRACDLNKCGHKYVNSKPHSGKTCSVQPLHSSPIHSHLIFINHLTRQVWRFGGLSH